MPGEKKTEKWNGPAVAVLLVNRPLRAEEIKDWQPKRGESHNQEQTMTGGKRG
jgi:hypothetical protein